MVPLETEHYHFIFIIINANKLNKHIVAANLAFGGPTPGVIVQNFPGK